MIEFLPLEENYKTKERFEPIKRQDLKPLVK